MKALFENYSGTEKMTHRVWPNITWISSQIDAQKDGRCNWGPGRSYQVLSFSYAVICSFIVNKWTFFFFANIPTAKIVMVSLFRWAFLHCGFLLLLLFLLFLDASSHLYKRVYPSISPSVRLSHCEHQREYQLIQVEKNLVIMQSFYHHKDALLALRALLSKYVHAFLLAS